MPTLGADVAVSDVNLSNRNIYLIALGFFFYALSVVHLNSCPRLACIFVALQLRWESAISYLQCCKTYLS